MTTPVARRLAAFGLETVGDLIEHFPRRYEDFRDRKQIRDLKVGEEATVRGVVERVRAERTARRRVDIVRAGCGTTPAPSRRSGSTSATSSRCWTRACA